MIFKLGFGSGWIDSDQQDAVGFDAVEVVFGGHVEMMRIIYSGLEGQKPGTRNNSTKLVSSFVDYMTRIPLLDVRPATLDP